MCVINLLTLPKKNKNNHSLSINNCLKHLIKFIILIFKNLKNKTNIIKIDILYYLKFIKFLTSYLFNKFFNKFNYFYFFLKLIVNTDTINFFITLNKLREMYMKITITKKDYTQLIYYAYYLEIMLLLIIEPIMPLLLDNPYINNINWASYIVKLFNFVSVVYKFGNSFKSIL